MQPGRATISAADSQPLSGMLMAAAFLDGPSEFTIDKIGEKPWIELTLHWLKTIGVKIENFDFEKIIIHGQPSYPPFQYRVPADLSSAIYPIAAALITNSELTLSNIVMDPTQGDRLAIEALQAMGAQIEIDEEMRALSVKQGPKLKGREIDINPFIDAITIFPVIACFCSGETRLINGSIARKKECDRITCIARELKKMGADIEELDDGLLIRPSNLHGAALDTYKDHRLVMSLAVAALAAQGKSKLHDTDMVKKSYSDFFSHLRFLGAQVNLDLG
jgi:3-phosphoshikimate 1-carboxyvinyltransferase